ncbi:MAG: glycosyltransferase family 2 protein [Rivularia sp. (in: cyanobacteria)]
MITHAAVLTEKSSSQLPLVSIIIPCYNAASMIERCLSSCLEQVYTNIEIIIVDNNSTDDSIKIANAVASNRLNTDIDIKITQCRQQGQNYALNYGFALARGDYIQCLDADDELTPNKIALQVNALEKNRDYDFAYGDWEWCFYKNEKCIWRMGFAEREYDDYLLQLLINNWKPPHAYLVRREAVMQLLTLPARHPKTYLSTDREYFTLAAILGYRFLYVSGATVIYNNWSMRQVTRDSSYTMRVESIRKMSQRFAKYAAMQPTTRITPQHWFLINLERSMWKLSQIRIKQHDQESFFIQHHQTGAKMQLNLAETNIVAALYKAGGVYTMEDHAFKIVRFLWQQIIASEVNKNNVAASLCELVGIPPRKYSHSKILTLLGQNSNIHLGVSLDAFIWAIPLYAPLFDEQRLAILLVLDKLRVNGFLSQVEPAPSY